MTKSSKIESDISAIDTWIRSYAQQSKHTVRNFRREAERFMMWLEDTKGRSTCHIPNVTVDDVNGYLSFLEDPYEFSADLLARYGKTMQPFRKGLSPASIRQTSVILHRMFEALRNLSSQGVPYVLMNPWALATKQKGRKTLPQSQDHLQIEQSLTHDEWKAVQETIEALPRQTERQTAYYHRIRWIFQLLYRTCLRRDEAANLMMSSFKCSRQGWMIHLVGKGNVSAAIVATSGLMFELGVYRKSLGLPEKPRPSEKGPAIAALIGGGKPVTAQVIYTLCRKIFSDTSRRIKDFNPESAERLERAGPHWMRHTGITHSMEAGVDPRYVQAQARHSSLVVTAKYDHKDGKRWREQLEGVDK